MRFIQLTDQNSDTIVVNPDHIVTMEREHGAMSTTVALITGQRLHVAQTIDELLTEIRNVRPI